MRSWTGIPELKNSYRTLGAVRFVAILLGVLVWVGIGAWLAITLDYPQAAGSTCRRSCMIEELWYSEHLIQQGGWRHLALFGWLWSMPAALVAALAYRLLKAIRGESKF